MGFVVELVIDICYYFIFELPGFEFEDFALFYYLRFCKKSFIERLVIY